eukprot:7163214-Karenia_brevis.AAC.1
MKLWCAGDRCASLRGMSVMDMLNRISFCALTELQQISIKEWARVWLELVPVGSSFGFRTIGPL